MRKGSALTALALAWPVAAAAQSAPETVGEQPIVVRGAGLPLPPGTPAYGIVTIDRKRLTDSASNRIENVLADVAGFQQFRRSDSRSANPSAQGATLRSLGGNASSRSLVVLDGVPMADPFFGYIPFSALVPDRLSLIRVTRGGGVGAFGAGAVAGTIELASATRADLPVMTVSGLYGSRDSTELSASLSPDLGGGYVSLSGRWDKGDGFQTTPKSQRVAATVPAAYDSWSAGLRAVAPLSTTSELQFRTLVFRDNRTLRFAGADSASSGEDASLRYVSRGRWQVDALGYVQARNFSNVVISASTFRKSLDQRNTPSTGLGGKIEIRPPLGSQHILRLGTDWRRASGDMFEDAYNAGLSGNPRTSLRHAGGNQTVLGLFGEDDWTIGRLILTAGVRGDRWTIRDGFYRAVSASTGAVTQNSQFPDRSGWELSGRGGALLHVSDALALRVAAYTGFRLPTLNELYRPFVVFPITTNANPALKPERLRGVEAGADLTPVPGTSIGATVFYNRLGDAIANVTLTGTTRERRNAQAIVAKGVELTAAFRSGAWSLLGSYAYSDSTVEAPGQPFDGKRPSQSPRHAASATLAWGTTGGATLSTTLRYVSKQYEDDLQTDALPGAVTVDAFAAVPLCRQVKLVGRVENLFDKAVVTRNTGGSIDLGTPRTLWIGVRVAE